METKMNMKLKTFCAAALAAALSMLPAEPVLAHGDGEASRVQARQLCSGGQVQGRGLARLGARSNDPARQALRDLVALECLYRRDGKTEQIETMYRDVLAKTTQPLLRSVAYRRLARMAWRKGEHAAAEDLLKRSLQENLK
jgi:hypothetical protein